MTKKLTGMQGIFLFVYGCISIATFYHTAWGFGTIMGDMPADAWGKVGWWFIGGLSAFAIDVGMAAIVISLVQGKNDAWLKGALVLLAVFSGYAQIVYSAHHAAAYALGEVAAWLQWLGYVLDARIVALPLVLPLFALIYAFAAKSYHVVQTQMHVQSSMQVDPWHRRLWAWLLNGKPAQVQAGPIAQSEPQPDDAPPAPQPQPEPIAQPHPQPAQEKPDTDERRKLILRKIRANAFTDQATVAGEYGVAPSTISRDLGRLQDQGMIAKQGDGYIFVGENGNGHYEN